MHIEATVTPQPLSTNLLSSASLLLFALGIGLIQANLLEEAAWWSSPLVGTASPMQVAWGGAVGALTALGLHVAGLRLWPRDSRWIFDALAAVKPSWWAATLLSLSAAAFEEVLFRAALVPSVGVVLATCLFTLVHYGLFLVAPSISAAFRAGAEIFFVGLIFCFVFLSLGLMAAIASHFVYNVVGFAVGREAWVQAHARWQAETAKPITR